MSARINELIGRRAVLISRAAMQREELERDVTQLRKPIHVLDNVISVGRRVTRHPMLISGVSAIIATTNWRRLAKLPKRLYQAWLVVSLFRKVRNSSGAVA